MTPNLVYRVAAELLEERVGQHERDHRLADHRRGRHRTDVASFDGRRRRAKIRLGSNEDGRFLTFRLAGDIHFTRGVARIQARIDLGIGSHVVQLELPDFEMAPANYRGERGVEIRVPLFKRTF